MRGSNIKKYNQPQIKWMQEIINYFQVHFVEDGCVSQVVEHQNKLFVKRTSTKSIMQVRLLIFKETDGLVILKIRIQELPV
jgi:hypothetical protein